MTISELNERVDSGEVDEFIRVCEARQRKRLSHIADEIVARSGVRLVLLAGGSSAGKTTTAKRLCTQIRVCDHEALQLSTDDYFVGDAQNPRDENGEPDYETIECVDMPRLAADLNALMRGEKIHPRRFDFLKHEGYDAEYEISLPKGAVIVLEGLHALNPRLTEGVDDACKFRIFVEPTTQPEVFGPTRLPSSEARLFRRLVRDNQFRKLSPFDTLRLWPKVLAGEKKWILPFRGLADAEFDSSLAYELAVLKNYVAGLLAFVAHKDPENTWCQVCSELFMAVHAVSPNAVPGDSILRETIGGSQLEY